MEQKRHLIDILFIVVLAGVFILSCTALTVLGSNVYKKTVSHNQQACHTRTASLYFDQKIHQSDGDGGLLLAPVENGSQALVLTERYYETWIFLADGWLREAAVKKGTPVTSGFGQQVLPLKSLSFDFVKPDLLEIKTISPEGTVSCIRIFLRTAVPEVNQ